MEKNVDSQNGEHKTVIIQQINRSNGVGVAGFVLALISLIFCWIPVLSWILWFLGILLSFIGIFKRPRGLAIAGLLISIVDFIMLIVVVGAFIGVLSFL